MHGIMVRCSEIVLCLIDVFILGGLDPHVVDLFCAGRIWNHRRAGGLKRNFYMIDFNRLGGTISAPQGGVLVEKIDKIMNDPNRSARIALVASGEHKRYIIATDNMQEGDAVKSTQILSRSPS